MPLRIHFLNVGQGDCTIVECPSGRLTLIDINNGKTLDASTRKEALAQYRATRSNQYQGHLAALAGLVPSDRHRELPTPSMRGGRNGGGIDDHP